MPEKLEVEWASSSRTNCQLCGENLIEGDLRIRPTSKGGRWCHPECFMEKTKGDVASLDEIKGFDGLRTREQQLLRKLAADSEKTRVDGLKTSDQQHSRKLAADSEKTCAEGPSKRLKTEEKGRGIPEAVPESIIDFSPSQLTSKYKDADLPEGWKAFSTVILNDLATDETLAKDKIAAFDFDGCLANTSLHRHGPDAWSLLYPSIPKKLQEYHKDGYKLVIFTNESTIDRWKNKRQKAIESKIGRLEGFMKLIDAPIQIFISCGKDGSDLYRKPNQGMWHLLEKHFNGGVPIDKASTLYVGDAAGRRTDHSDADLAFAKAIGLRFFLPEDIF